MHTEQIANRQIKVLDPNELQYVVQTLRGAQKESLNNIAKQMPSYKGHPISAIYNSAQALDAHGKELPIEKLIAIGLETLDIVSLMSHADPTNYELPFLQAKLNELIGGEVRCDLQDQANISANDLRYTLNFFSKAQTYGKIATDKFAEFSQGLPEIFRAYATLISATICSAGGQSSLAHIKLRKDIYDNGPDEEKTKIVMQGAKNHRAYNKLLDEGIFTDRQSALEILVNFGNSLLLGAPADHANAKKYFQAARSELGDLTPILEGLYAIEKVKATREN